MATVSFDFDFTLWDDEQQCFIDETVAVLREHVRAGDRVIIVTARMPSVAAECAPLITKFLKLDLEVFSAPGNPADPNETDPIKSDVLIAEKACKHFDDLTADSGFDKAREDGIEILLPPATKATFARMY